MNLMLSLFFLLCIGIAYGDDPVYGREPWLWWGNPLANKSAVVMSPSGKHRFTVLSQSLLRLEFSPSGSFEDSRSLPIWNRALPVPEFSVSLGTTTTIDTTELLLSHFDDGLPFSDASLSVTRRGPAFWNSSVWRPSLTPSSDPGQLFGTFHNLDGGHDGYGQGGMNCTLLDPNAFGPSFDYFPCDFGLLSKGGFSVVDDSRTPVWDESVGWLVRRTGSVCSAGLGVDGTNDSAPCFPGGWDVKDPDFCLAAGCCPGNPLAEVNLWYSASRNDHFTDNLNCTGGCDGFGYKFLHAQAQINVIPGAGLVPLNLYWNEAPTKNGAAGDNVASTFPPTQPGYTFARLEGYVFDPQSPQPPNTLPLKLFYSSAGLDHWTTAGPADEAAAIAAGYALVGLVGYALPPPPSGPPSPPTPPALHCIAPSQRASSQDWYLFGHGLNYSGALGDYVSVAGPVGLPRRHWMGVSWSTWDESLNRNSTLAQLEELSAGGWPLDTFIFDMEWHLKPSWGGYQWDEGRYGNVSSLLSTLHAAGLALGMNLHDGDGVQKRDNPETWAAFAAASGVPPTSTGVPFAIGEKRYADALAGAVMAPLMAGYAGAPADAGLDLCWTDWQQGFGGVSSVPGLVPTAILNHYRFYNCSGTGLGTRGTLHSRYAGRGDHRHTSHFGGDVNESWESLKFMIDFTKTAANAPACWWGHEMMREGGGINDASELYVRTNQFGAWSPTFTSWGNSGENNFWWNMPEPFASAMKNTLLDRQRLLPYRYSLAALAAKTGVCPIRSMHFDPLSSLQPEAYGTPGQYLLGDALIVAPPTAPVSNPPIPPSGGGGGGGVVMVPVWVPPPKEGGVGSDWLDFNDPNSPPVPAGGWMNYSATIDCVPVLVRAGSVIPTLPRKYASVWGISAKNYDALVFSVYPGGEGVGGFDVYEDDGASTDFLRGQVCVVCVCVCVCCVHHYIMSTEKNLFSLHFLSPPPLSNTPL